MYYHSDHPFVSIIIPTYNRSGTLRKTLESFLALSYPKSRYEILVSDNNSSDNTHEIVCHLSQLHSEIRYHFEPRQGVHFARNTAAKMSRGDILYFTDDDMIADSGLLEPLVEMFKAEERIGCVTGKVLPFFTSDPPGWVTRCMINSLLSLTSSSREEELIVTRACIAYSCHQAIRRDVFFATGGFNPENIAGVWIGDGETGLNLKMRDQGWLFGYTAGSVIFHIIPPERMTLHYLIKRFTNQGNCDSCTEYRRHRQPREILPRMIRRNTLGLIRIALETVINLALREESWHFIPARVVYFHRRNLYDMKLLFNGQFRKLIEVDDWLLEGNNGGIDVKR